MRWILAIGLFLVWFWQALNWFFIGFDRDSSGFHFDGTGVAVQGVLCALAFPQTSGCVDAGSECGLGVEFFLFAFAPT